jgi:hypothetical protein
METDCVGGGRSEHGERFTQTARRKGGEKSETAPAFIAEAQRAQSKPTERSVDQVRAKPRKTPIGRLAFRGTAGAGSVVEVGKLLLEMLDLGEVEGGDVGIVGMIGGIVLVIVFGAIEGF